MISHDELLSRVKRARMAARDGLEALDPIGADQVTNGIAEAHRAFQRSLAWLVGEIVSLELKAGERD